VNTWGWEAFSSFYRDMHPAKDNSQATAIDTALKQHFQLTFAELEAKFIDALGRIPVTAVLRDDLRLTVGTLIRSGVTSKSSTIGILRDCLAVDAGAMRSRGIVADYLRHPAGAENQALEVMLWTLSMSLDGAV